MAIRLPGGGGRRPDIGRSFVVGAVAVALVLPLTQSINAAPKSETMLLAAMPMPRPSPLRVAPKDAIGALIAGTVGSESRAVEDSDAPQVGETYQPDMPMPPAPGGAPNTKGLKLALDLLEKGDVAGATFAAYSLPNRTDIKIVEWMIASGSNQTVPASTIAELSGKLSDWPNQALMRLRYEQALAREKPSAQTVINALGGRKPASDEATLMLAHAYVDRGQTQQAADLIRSYWRDANFSEGIEKALVRDFGSMLRVSDHKWRMDRLIYAEREGEALRASRHLSADQQKLAKAILAVVLQKKGNAKGLEAVPASLRKDHLYVYARVQVLRRAGKITDAAALLNGASRDPAMIVDPDAWWIERRMISRSLIDSGNPRLAYQVASAHSAQSSTLRAEAEFHSGWYALEYLRDPNTAVRHFANIAAVSSMPLSMSRAEYWLGRAYAAAGNRDLAATHFQRAGAYPTTFYGQLALARLGARTLPVSQPPAPSKAVTDRFFGRELVQAIRHLTAVGYNERAGVLYRHLSETLTDPAEIALLARMAETDGRHQVALQIGKLAAGRGMPVNSLAFPTAAIPSSTKTTEVERPVVFAIARQESAFNPGAISGAGARGLLQLMPATAREVAKSVGLPYSRDRLTSDPAYNARLGAAYLGGLVDRFGGSYVMSFAAYNAGASRVADWVAKYGDPRDPNVDVVNWIENIPFTETRNYVQRIMENLQVYRARLGSPMLTIEDDLRRGARS